MLHICIYRYMLVYLFLYFICAWITSGITSPDCPRAVYLYCPRAACYCCCSRAPNLSQHFTLLPSSSISLCCLSQHLNFCCPIPIVHFCCHVHTYIIQPISILSNQFCQHVRIDIIIIIIILHYSQNSLSCYRTSLSFRTITRYFSFAWTHRI